MRTHALISALIVAIGLALLVYMVTVESEPGAIPILLILAGVAWYLVARRRSSARMP